MMNDDVNNRNHNSGNAGNLNGVGGNLSPAENPKNKVVVTRKPTLKGSTVDDEDVPFVRAHSPISQMNRNRSTKGSSAAVPPSFSTLGSNANGNYMMLTPQLVGMIGGGDIPPARVMEIGSCLCWNTTDDGHTREVECKCTGQEMTNVTSLLPPDIHRL